MIPDTSAGAAYQKRRHKILHVTAMPVRDVAKSILVLLAATLVGYGFYTLGFSEANIVSVYIFGVLVISVITTSRFCGAAASVVSVLVFNFFFTAPRLTFRFSNPNYLVTFLIMFMVALLTGSLATRLKNSAKQSANAAYRTKILFETNQLLQKETDEQSVINAAAGQLLKLLQRDIVVYLSKGQELHLMPIEYKLLCLLSKNVGKVLTHTFITQNIWGRSWENDVASLRVFMATLRKKLEPAPDSPSISRPISV